MGKTYGWSLPAPTAGLNLIDSIDRLDELEALECQNLYPNGQKVELAGGFEDFATQSVDADPVQSLFELTEADGTVSLIAAGNDLLSDVTTGTEVDITGTTTPTSNDWQGTIFGHNLFICNGEDTVQQWAGSSTFTDATFTGVTLADLIYAFPHKERIYFIEKDSTSVWYGNPKARSGALTEKSFAYFLKRGGFLVAGGSFPNQVQQSDELMFVFSTEGELLLYTGSYPGDPNFQLVSRFYIGKPLGRRCVIEVQNDNWLLTNQGIVPISLLFQSGASFAQNSVSRKINPVILQAAKNYPFSSLWQGCYWQGGNRIYLTVPVSANDTRVYVCNAETGAWNNYFYNESGIVYSISQFGSEIMYGSKEGKVRKVERSYSHNGDPIPIRLKYGYNYFGDRMSYKRFHDVRPLALSQGESTLQIGIDTDYRNLQNNDNITINSLGSTPWGSPWGSPWAEPATLVYDRHSISGQGHSGALKLTGTVNTAGIEFYAFELGIEGGARI